MRVTTPKVNLNQKPIQQDIQKIFSNENIYIWNFKILEKEEYYVLT